MTTEISSTEVRIPVPWGFIAAKSWGNPLGYPILAVHGTMDNAASFDKLAPLLPGKFLCIAVDLPGHGRSSHFPDGLPYHFMDLVISLKRVVDYFKWESLYFVGHSLGGMIGSFFAATYPELVKRLVMIDAVKPYTHRMDVHSDLFRFTYEALFEIERKVNNSKKPTYNQNEMLDRLISARVNKLNREPGKLLLARSIKAEGNDGKFAFSTDQKLKALIHVPLTKEQLYQALSNLQCKLLIVLAKETIVQSQINGGTEMLEVFRKSCSLFELVVVDGSHNVHMNNPEVVALWLGKFLLKSTL